ncbi:MAG: hypothetical protein WDM81_15020 [Rhizomicrobium sp.]
MRLGDGGAHAALGRLGEHDLGAEQAQHLAPLQRHRIRHDEDQLVALGGRDEGERDAGIAAGRLDQGRLARRDDALGFQGLDHADADAVLHARQRIEEFELEQDVRLDARLLRQAAQPHQRRIADGLGDRLVDTPAPGFALLHISLLRALLRPNHQIRHCPLVRATQFSLRKKEIGVARIRGR